jgi:hypothetical protein
MKIWCDTCKNFPKNSSTKIINCFAGIKMRFRMPRSPIDYEWGFWVENCDKFERVDNAKEKPQHDQ